MRKQTRGILEESRIKPHSAAGVLFCLGLLLKPLYILPSGSLQLGDISLLLSLFVLVVNDGLSFRICRGDLRYLFFVACVVFINGLYYCQYQTTDFLLQSAYYAFNFLTIVAFRILMRSSQFLWHATQALRFDIYLQVIVYAAGLGRWYAGGSDRYMGTFNDPNQLAFFIFSAFIFIEISSTKMQFRKSALDAFAALFVIIQTASTGMLVGFCILLVALVFRDLKRFFLTLRIPRIAPIVAVIVLALAASTMMNGGIKTNTDSVVLERLEEKIRKISGTGQGESDFHTSILIDRQIDKLFLYPERLLYGAGQGDFSRFTRASGSNEVHSTLPGILFYYGIFPFTVLMSWIVGCFRKTRLTFEIALMYVAFFLESCTLANQRQPLFWIVIMLASLTWAKTSPQQAKSGEGTISRKRHSVSARKEHILCTR